MSSLLKGSVLLLAAMVLTAPPALADEARPAGSYALGRTPTAAEIEGWAIAVRPDGQGLPAGKGSVDQGAED